MSRYLRSLLLVTLMAPFQFGCGGEQAPMTPASDTADPIEELDPAVEAAAEKEAKKNP